MTLDSGCCDHVMDAGEAPGYCILESAGSKRRQNFVVGNGSKVPNQGEVHLNLDAKVGEGLSSLRSVFQVAEITRPLMSVSRICDQDLDWWFSKKVAKILNQQGGVLAVFGRVGGLYEARMKLRAPKPVKLPTRFGSRRISGRESGLTHTCSGSNLPLGGANSSIDASCDGPRRRPRLDPKAGPPTPPTTG